MSSEQIGAFRRFFAAGACCCRTVLAAVFGLITALLIFRFLELLVGFRDALLLLGRISADGPELHDTDVPLPLSDELLGGCFVVCSFGRFLLVLRLEDELLRFLSLERRFGFTSSFRRRLEDFRPE